MKNQINNRFEISELQIENEFIDENGAAAPACGYESATRRGARSLPPRGQPRLITDYKTNPIIEAV